jgi:hypothetical protein
MTVNTPADAAATTTARPKAPSKPGRLPAANEPMKLIPLTMVRPHTKNPETSLEPF